MDYLNDALDSFRCYKDIDIESFLRTKALEYLHRGWCSIYLLLDEASFNDGKIKIDAYFTLSHKSLTNITASKTSVKAASWFPHSDSIHFVLIGQLGKYIACDEGNITSSGITSKEILDFAFEIIRDSNELIPCRCALVECGNELKVQKVYMDYGFKFFQDDGKHKQYYKRI